MRSTDRTDYIVGCIREAGSMYPEDAKAFLAEHDADRRTEVLTEVGALLRGELDAYQAEPRWQAGKGDSRGPGMVRAHQIVSDLAFGKNTSDACQAPAGVSTQTAPVERVTVYLSPTSSAALIRAVETIGDNKTDTINRAIQTYALMAGEVADGGRVLVQPAGESTQPADAAALLALATVLEIPRPSTGIPLQLRLSHGHTDRWAICDQTGRRWYRNLGWMYEPADDRLCDEGRFTLAQAVPLARQLADGATPTPPGGAQ